MSHKFFRLLVSLMIALSVTAITTGTQSVRAAGPWYVTNTGDDNNDCLSPGTPSVPRSMGRLVKLRRGILSM